MKTIAICAFCIGVVLSAPQLSIVVEQNTYNIGEQIEMTCVAQLDAPLLYKSEMKWFKTQEGDFALISTEDNVLAQFKDTGRFSASSTYDDDAQKVTYVLTISASVAADTGDYKCQLVDSKGNSQGESASSSVTMNTADESIVLALTTDPESSSTPILFNIGRKVECKASAGSLSENLDLTVSLKNGASITNDFKRSSNVIWNGDIEALKTPKTHVALVADNWQPQTSGEYELHCFFQDGARQLATQSFQLLREEEASVECTTNYRRAVKVDDLDAYIMCKVLNSDSNPEELTVDWSFIHDDETVMLKTGETKYLRIASRTNEGFKLAIPRITSEMVKDKHFDYTVTVRRGDKAIADTKFSQQTDPTARVNSSASYMSAALGVTLLAMSMAMFL